MIGGQCVKNDYIFIYLLLKHFIRIVCLSHRDYNIYRVYGLSNNFDRVKTISISILFF